MIKFHERIWLLQNGWLLLVGVLTLSCNGLSDPGWAYASLGGRPVMRDGLWYELSPAQGISTQVSGNLFGGTLSVDIELRNMRAEPIQVDMRGLTVRDRQGGMLRRRIDFPTTRCDGERRGDACVLLSSQTCRLARGFNAKPFASGIGGFLRRRNQDLASITMGVNVSTSGPPGTEHISVPLVWR